MRRGRRDVADAIERGRPVYMGQPIHIKRFSTKKILKYIILIVLGVALHSIYREMFREKHDLESLQKTLEKSQTGFQNKNPNNKDNEEKVIIKDKIHNDLPKSRVLEDSSVPPETRRNIEEQAREISQKLFEAANKRQKELEETRRQQKENQLKNTEDLEIIKVDGADFKDVQDKVDEIVQEDQVKGHQSLGDDIVLEKKETNVVDDRRKEFNVKAHFPSKEEIDAIMSKKKIMLPDGSVVDNPNTGSEGKIDNAGEDGKGGKNRVDVQQSGVQNPSDKGPQQGAVQGAGDLPEDKALVDESIKLQEMADIAEESMRRNNISDKDPHIDVKESVLDGMSVKKVAESNLAQDLPGEFLDAARRVQILEEVAEPQVRADGTRLHDIRSIPPFVTAAWQTKLHKVKQLIISIQHFYPKAHVYVWNIDLTRAMKKELTRMCRVHVEDFLIQAFPKHFRRPNDYYWFPLVLSTAMGRFEHLTWLNPESHLTSDKLRYMVEQSSRHGVLVMGQEERFTTFAVTHPNMYRYLKPDRDRLYSAKHVKVYALMIHNENKVKENLVDLLIACALEPDCMAPKGARWDGCQFDVDGKLYASCHRYFESALNILLNQWFDYDQSQFMVGNCCFTDYEEKYTAKPLICDTEEDSNNQRNKRNYRELK